jgi:aspartyl-tRNA(Asn)/glutamyl-tRNA(Gln) amidotransferase subunit B
MNSFRFIEKAVNFEIERQIEVLEDGGEVVQETRLYDSDKDETRPMRTKEEANDYRYFPDPDLLPVELDEVFIESVRKSLPELPDAKLKRFVEKYKLKAADAEILTVSRALADYFEMVAESTVASPQVAANWVTGDLSAALNKENIDIGDSKIEAPALAVLLNRIADDTISGKIAKEVFDAMWSGEGSADDIIEAKGLKQITDNSAIEDIVDAVIEANPGQVADYRGGKVKLLGFFVGQVMKETGGKANPGQVNEILKKKLSGS